MGRPPGTRLEARALDRSRTAAMQAYDSPDEMRAIQRVMRRVVSWLPALDEHEELFLERVRTLLRDREPRDVAIVIRRDRAEGMTVLFHSVTRVRPVRGGSA